MAEQLERETVTVKITHFCQWCATDFDVTVNREQMQKIAAGEPCVTCTNCKLEC